MKQNPGTAFEFHFKTFEKIIVGKIIIGKRKNDALKNKKAAPIDAA
jgi:hypothetical protein